MRADTRRLTALLRLLRQNGVAEFSDGTVQVKFAPPRSELAAASAAPPDEVKPDAEAMHEQRLRALMGGLFNSDGEVG